MKADWTRTLASAGGAKYERRVRDGRVVVQRPPRSKSWLIFHSGIRSALEFASAKEAMEHVDDAEAGG